MVLNWAPGDAERSGAVASPGGCCAGHPWTGDHHHCFDPGVCHASSPGVYPACYYGNTLSCGAGPDYWFPEEGRATAARVRHSRLSPRLSVPQEFAPGPSTCTRMSLIAVPPPAVPDVPAVPAAPVVPAVPGPAPADVVPARGVAAPVTGPSGQAL
ncbi:nematocyst expressed protein 3-like [Macrobrachium nipponense]|uniref:nematocyst expressed protein 3-like n=1 Tax=Macrobrachium nipponense TaxID=159736 RepID=UPI0030C835FE